jgi:hypothetical protein
MQARSGDTCNPNTPKAEAGGLQVSSQPGKIARFCLKKKKEIKNFVLAYQFLFFFVCCNTGD